MTDPARDHGVRVRDTPPPPSAVLAPERSVSSGRYVGEGRRNKDRSQQRQRHEAPRAPHTPAARRLAARPAVVAAAGLGIVAVIAVAALALAGGGDKSASDTTIAAALGAGSSIVAADPVSTAATDGSTVGADTVGPSTAAAPTTGPTPTAAPAVEAAIEAWTGDYSLVATVTDGNPNFPVGTVTDFDVTFEGRCIGSRCSVRSPEFGDRAFQVAGDALTLTISGTEPCPDGGPGTTTTTAVIRFDVTGRNAQGEPVSASGEQTLASPNAASDCPGSGSDPVTYNYALTRTD